MKRYITLLLSVFLGLHPFLINAQDQFYNPIPATPEAAAFSQFLDARVNIATGIPDISVPIYTINHAGLNIPINLSYHAGGIALAQPATWVGQNWNLFYGGTLTRQVKGVPDEDNNGFMNKHSQLTFPPGPNSATVLHYSDQHYWQVANNIVDGEADIFSFAIPGYGGRFYIDENGEVIQFPTSDVRIDYTYDANANNDERLKQFVVTDPSGIKYYFGQNSAGQNESIDRLQMNNYGFNGNYPTGFLLTQVVHPYMQVKVNFFYQEEQSSAYSYSPSQTMYLEAHFNGWPQNIDNAIRTTPGSFSLSGFITHHRITSISTSDAQFEVSFTAQTLREDIANSAERALDKITIKQGGQCFSTHELNYDYYSAPNTSDWWDKRLRLLNVQQKSCDGSISIPPHVFTYNGNSIPGLNSKQIDHWGYYNGASQNDTLFNVPSTEVVWSGNSDTVVFGGADRETHEQYMLKGVLTSMTLPTGGEVFYNFEANEYLDPYSNDNAKIGGLRIKSTKLQPGGLLGAPIEKSYTYESTSGVSSGQLIAKPLYYRKVVQPARVTSDASQPSLVVAVIDVSAHVINEASFMELNSFDNRHVYYKKVQVINSDGGNQELSYAPIQLIPPENTSFFPCKPNPYQFNASLVKQTETFNAYMEPQAKEVNTWITSKTIDDKTMAKVTGVPISTTISNSFCTGAVYLNNRFNYETAGGVLSQSTTSAGEHGINSTTDYTYRSDLAHRNPIGVTVTAGAVSQSTQTKYAHDKGETVLIDKHIIGVPLETTIDGGAGGGTKTDWDGEKPVNFYTYGSPTGTSGWNLKGSLSYDANNYPDKFYPTHENFHIDYDYANGLLQSKKRVAPSGQRQSSYTYYANRLVESITTEDNQTSTFIYDKLGRLRNQSNQGGKSSSTHSYSYGSVNKMTKTTSYADGIMRTVVGLYDGLGRRIRSINKQYTPTFKDLVVSNEYDGNGRVVSECDPRKGGCSQLTYEAHPLNTLESELGMSDIKKSTFVYWYNFSPITAGGLSHPKFTLHKKETTNANGNVSRTFTDVLGRTVLSEQLMETGEQIQTSYGYNERGQITEIKNPNGQMYSYSYYPDSSLKSKTIPQQGTTSYTYYASGQIETITLPNGDVLEHTYTDFNELEQVNLNGQKIRHLTYHQAGAGLGKIHIEQNHLLNDLSKLVQHTYAYDNYGRVSSKTTIALGTTDQVSYTYNDRDLITEEVRTISGPENHSITKKYEYDHSNRLLSIDMNIDGIQERLSEMTYNEVDLLEKKILGTQCLQTIDYYYNSKNLITGINDAGGISPNEEDLPDSPMPFPDDGGEYSGDLLVEYDQDEIANGTPTNIHIQLNINQNNTNGTTLAGDNFDLLIPLHGNRGRTMEYRNSKNYSIDGRISPSLLAQVITRDLDPGRIIDGDGDGQLTTIDQIANEIEDGLNDNTDEEWLDEEEQDGDCNQDLFKQRLYYDVQNDDLNAPAQYNGNISTIKWTTTGQEELAYGFKYDELNRLLKATSSAEGMYSTSYSYDNIGNIQSLTREGIQINGDNGTIDNLSYSYSGGLLSSVTDAADKAGFPIKGTVSYSYDNSGNVTSASGLIDQIDYNHLNLPNSMSEQGMKYNRSIDFTYDATGVKWKQVSNKEGVERTTLYVNGLEFENGKTRSILHEEGRFVRIEENNNLFTHEFVINDHLGNARVRFSDLNNDGIIEIPTDEETGEVTQTNDYYPFGLSMNKTITYTPANKYTYNGKEELGVFDLSLLDYGARLYVPSIGRWGSVDPLASKYPDMSPYNYVGNNPINAIDIHGDSITPIFGASSCSDQNSMESTIPNQNSTYSFTVSDEYGNGNTHGYVGPSGEIDFADVLDQTGAILSTASAVTGVVALAVPPTAPVLGPVSLGLGVTGAGMSGASAMMQDGVTTENVTKTTINVGLSVLPVKIKASTIYNSIDKTAKTVVNANVMAVGFTGKKAASHDR